MSTQYCDPAGERGSDDCQDGDRVPEQYSEDCADCMLYTSSYCDTDEEGKLVKNPSFCDGRDGPEPRCFPKRDQKCHVHWQCAPVFDRDDPEIYYPTYCNRETRECSKNPWGPFILEC